MAEFKLKVNGTARTVDVEPDTPLLWVLRDELKLTGTKFGCGIAQCGACTVHLDGEPARACVVPMSLLGTREVTTIEGVAGKVADAVKKAWTALDVPQCGYCQPGQIMTAVGILSLNDAPTDDEINAGMAGNICRCASYVRIRQAVRDASKSLKG